MVSKRVPVDVRGAQVTHLDRRFSPSPITAVSLVRDFFSLGVRVGDALLVHSSVRALGWVCGGATAVVSALLEVLGSDGTLVVPAFSSDNRDPSLWAERSVPQEWWPEIREHLPPFDARTTSCWQMGAVAEQVRVWPGARRSCHPQTSFAAIGRMAGPVTRDHELTCHLGEYSPLAQLEELDAKVLLLGVGFERCTAFHLAEYRLPDPPKRRYACVISEGSCTSGEAGGRLDRRWCTFDDISLDDSDFGALGEDFERETGAVSAMQVGLDKARLFAMRGAVAYAQQWLAHGRRVN